MTEEANKKPARYPPCEKATDAIQYITAATKYFALESEEPLPPMVKRVLEWLKADNEKRVAKKKQ